MTYIIGIEPANRDTTPAYAPLTLGATTNYKAPTTASNGTVAQVTGSFNGCLFIYAQVATGQTIVPGDVVSIDGSAQASQMTKALADALHRVAIAPTAPSGTTAFTNLTAGQWGWFQIFGQVNGVNAGASTQDVAMYTTATAGRVSSTATSQTLIRGLAITTTIGAAAVTPARAATILSAT